MTGQFPVLLNVKDRLCLVIGGGEVALRKVKTLVELGALVRVISPEAHEGIKKLVESGTIEWDQKKYQQGDLEGAFLCVAATHDPEINAEVRHEANVRRVLTNVADDPEGSDYQVPSFFQDGPLVIAVSTGGASPAVARTLRRMIQSYLGSSFGQGIEMISGFRERVKAQVSDAGARVKFWEQGVTPELLEKLRQGDLEDARKALEKALSRIKSGTGSDSG